jgi:hypothetical protein
MWTRRLPDTLTIVCLLVGPSISCSAQDTEDSPTASSSPFDTRLEEVREFVIEDVSVVKSLQKDRGHRIV